MKKRKLVDGLKHKDNLVPKKRRLGVDVCEKRTV